MLKKLSISVITLVVISVLTLASWVAFADNGQNSDAVDENPELPKFQPSIADKMTYAKFYESPRPSVPLADGEIVDIVFSKEWLLKNDMDPSLGTIMITFPETWIKEPPGVSGDDTVHLHIPKLMLELNNTSRDSTQVTLSLRSGMFAGYSDSEEWSSQLPSLYEFKDKDDGETTKAIEYSERDWYYKTVSQITRTEGSVCPYFYRNNGETFLTYHEMEIYTDSEGHLIEFISEFSDSGDEYVWVAVFVDGVWETSKDWLLIEVYSLWDVDYYCYLQNDQWDVWLYDIYGDDWYYNSYEDDDPTELVWLCGSTEIDTEGGISNDFLVTTDPIITYRVGTSSTWYVPEDAFDYNSSLHMLTQSLTLIRIAHPQRECQSVLLPQEKPG